MKKFIYYMLVSALIIISLLPGAAVFAADSLCISQIKIEAGDNAAEKLEDGGYTVLFQNLNPSGGDRIYLGYKLGAKSLTDLIVSSELKASVTVNSVTYTPVSTVNLNQGTNGKPVYLYGTSDTKAGGGIISLNCVKDNKDGGVKLLEKFGDGSVPVRTADGGAADFDEGLEKRDTYFFMIKENSCRPYISDIKIINVGAGENAFEKIVASGCDYFNSEPVAKSNGASTYLCYNRTADASEAVRFVSASDSAEIDGITYINAGSYTINGENVNLYYTKDKTVGNPVSEITKGTLTNQSFTLSDWAKSYFSTAESSATSSIYSEDLYNSLIESEEEYTQLKIKNNSGGDIGLYMILSAKGLKENTEEEKIVTIPSQNNGEEAEMQRDTEVTGIEKEETTTVDASENVVARGSAISGGSFIAIAVMAIIAVIIAIVFVIVKGRKKTLKK